MWANSQLSKNLHIDTEGTVTNMKTLILSDCAIPIYSSINHNYETDPTV